MLVSRYSSETWKSRNNLMQAENELIMVSKKLNGKIQPGPAPLFSPQLYKKIYNLNRIKIKIIIKIKYIIIIKLIILYYYIKSHFLIILILFSAALLPLYMS